MRIVSLSAVLHAVRRKRSKLYGYVSLLVIGCLLLFSLQQEQSVAYRVFFKSTNAYQMCNVTNAVSVDKNHGSDTSRTLAINAEELSNVAKRLPDEKTTRSRDVGKNVIQYKLNAPASEICSSINRPKENELKKYKNVYHVISNFKNNSYAYFLNTYFDNRVKSYEDIIIRTISTANFDLMQTGIYASFWYPGLAISFSIKCHVYNHAPGPFGPNAVHYGFKRFTIACVIPRHWAAGAPEKVSLSVPKCARPINYIDVVIPPPKDGNNLLIGNCMQSLFGDFNDEFVLMFVNWMESINQYGVSEVTVNLNNFTNHELGRKVFKYYENKGILKITNYPDIVPPDTTLREQVVGRIQSFIELPFMDCFFRNMNRYWYFLPIDVDELFVLKNNKFKTYQDYITHIIRKEPTVENSIYLTSYLAGRYLNYGQINSSTVPEYLPLFRYAKRDRLRIGGHKKSFQNPRTCLYVNYHGCKALDQSAQRCEQCGYKVKVLPSEEIVLNHYRHSCKRNDGCLEPEKAISDSEFMPNETRNMIHKRVKDTLTNVGYFK